ncbi:MAG: hypothetical protein HYU36_05235 [Planctomycetes bacterium]|nr:hypothetical protein [Planctomycetota bacterium]
MLTCSSCGHSYPASGLPLGSLTRCPQCQGINRITRPDETARPASAPPASPGPIQGRGLAVLACCILALVAFGFFHAYRRFHPAAASPQAPGAAASATESPNPPTPLATVESTTTASPTTTTTTSIPDDPGYESLADALIAQGDADGVLRLAEEVKGRLPFVAEARAIKIQELLQQGRNLEARHVCQELLRTHPGHPEAWLGIARLGERENAPALQNAVAYKRFLAAAPADHRDRALAESGLLAAGQRLFAWKEQNARVRREAGRGLVGVALSIHPEPEKDARPLFELEKIRLLQDGFRLLRTDPAADAGHSEENRRDRVGTMPDVAVLASGLDVCREMAWNPSTSVAVRPALYRLGLALAQELQQNAEARTPGLRESLATTLALLRYLTRAYPLASQALDSWEAERTESATAGDASTEAGLAEIRRAIRGLLAARGLERFHLAGQQDLPHGASLECYELDVFPESALPWEEALWIERRPDTGHGRVHSLTSVEEMPGQRRWDLFEHASGQSAGSPLQSYGHRKPPLEAVTAWVAERCARLEFGGPYSPARYGPALRSAQARLQAIRLTLGELESASAAPGEAPVDAGPAQAIEREEILDLLHPQSPVLLERLRLLAPSAQLAETVPSRQAATFHCLDGRIRLEYTIGPRSDFIRVETWEMRP